MLRILIADPHILTREGLIELLSVNPDIEVVDSTGLAREAIEKTVAKNPDILLLEMNFPDGNGLHVLKTVYACCPNVSVVILTSQMPDNLLLRCVENGAKGYLLKNIPVSQLIESLKGVARGETAFQRSTTRRLVDYLAREKNAQKPAVNLGLLTDREQQVLALISQGSSNLEIANKLQIAENTVKVHVRKILEKLNLKNRREARYLMSSLGLSDPSNGSDFFLT